MTTAKAFITGITGQDGSYLAELLLDKGYEVHGLIRRASQFNTQRIDHLYCDPHDRPPLTMHFGDLLDATSLRKVLETVQPQEVYHLAAQSHVRVSFDLPVYTADTVALGTQQGYITHTRKNGTTWREPVPPDTATLQEIARELNTTGAKSQDAPLAQLVVQTKVEVERMREQVQNVE